MKFIGSVGVDDFPIDEVGKPEPKLFTGDEVR